MKKIRIVAEAGVNHNGDKNLAFKLIDAAYEAGADIVKFQTFHAEDDISQCAPKAAYQKNNTDPCESQLDMVRKLELAPTVFKELKQYAEKRGIQFWSTAFDSMAIDLLRDLGIEMWKIPSGEITNPPFLRKIGEFGNDIILSTGMAKLGEVEEALNILENAGTPRNKITLLHCTTEYPAPLESVNLLAMRTLAHAFPGIAGVGYSDHTSGIDIPLAAAALGATLIEKHFTLDKSLPGPDHSASLEPHELAAMVSGIRNISQALGDGIKRPSAVELENRKIARKSLVAARKIHKGEKFSLENMTTKRPGTGVSAIFWDEYLGKQAQRNYEPDELI